MGRNRKKFTENDFNKEIAAILSDAASLAPNQQIPQPAQQAKPLKLKPAVVFHADTCPSKEKLKEKINDEDYSAKFAKLSVSKDGKLEYLQYPVDTFHDICINYALNAGMDPEFRELVEKYRDKNAIECITSIRSIAIRGIVNKINTMYFQVMLYGIGMLVNSVSGILADSGYNKCADMLDDAFSFSCNESKLQSYVMGVYPNITDFIGLIGSSRVKGSNIEYDDACLFVFNSIVDCMLAEAQANVCRVVKTITAIISSPVGPNSPDIMVDVNQMALDIFSNLSKSFFDNASAALNEIIFVSDTLYGNAEFPSNAFEYYGEF